MHKWKINFKLQKCKLTQGKTREGWALISSRPTHTHTHSKTYVHPLSALHSSHQIKFLLRSALVLYLQNVLLEQHKHVTMRTLWGVSHRVKPASWSNHLHFCFCLLWLSSSLSRGFLISLFVFHQWRLFLENRPLRMCKLRSCFWRHKPTSRRSQIEWTW